MEVILKAIKKGTGQSTKKIIVKGDKGTDNIIEKITTANEFQLYFYFKKIVKEMASSAFITPEPIANDTAVTSAGIIGDNLIVCVGMKKDGNIFKFLDLNKNPGDEVKLFEIDLILKKTEKEYDIQTH